MQQIKIFKGIESEILELEGRVNTWISENDARIINVFGNIAPQSESHRGGGLAKGYTPSDVLLVVVYEKG